MIEVELLTREGCHLCDEMKRALTDASRGMAVRVTETDIDTDPDLVAEYGHDIPVLFVNGSKAFKHRASVHELRRRLRMTEG